MRRVAVTQVTQYQEPITDLTALKQIYQSFKILSKSFSQTLRKHQEAAVILLARALLRYSLSITEQWRMSSVAQRTAFVIERQ